MIMHFFQVKESCCPRFGFWMSIADFIAILLNLSSNNL